MVDGLTMKQYVILTQCHLRQYHDVEPDEFLLYLKTLPRQIVGDEVQIMGSNSVVLVSLTEGARRLIDKQFPDYFIETPVTYSLKGERE